MQQLQLLARLSEANVLCFSDKKIFAQELFGLVLTLRRRAVMNYLITDLGFLLPKRSLR
jgi:hypothetical protein